MRGRPVAARASLIAASTASVPVFAGTIAAMRAGARATSGSARRPEERDAELGEVAAAGGHHALRAAMTSGWFRPTANTP